MKIQSLKLLAISLMLAIVSLSISTVYSGSMVKIMAMIMVIIMVTIMVMIMIREDCPLRLKPVKQPTPTCRPKLTI